MGYSSPLKVCSSIMAAIQRLNKRIVLLWAFSHSLAQSQKEGDQASLMCELAPSDGTDVPDIRISRRTRRFIMFSLHYGMPTVCTIM